jgi:hypothetical protein
MAEVIHPAGSAPVTVYADGQVTGLNVHVRESTRLATREFPAEGRVVLEIGSPQVSVFLSQSALAALIDRLNAAYLRLSEVPRPSLTRCAQSLPAGALPRRRLSQRTA